MGNVPKTDCRESCRWGHGPETDLEVSFCLILSYFPAWLRYLTQLPDPGTRIGPSAYEKNELQRSRMAMSPSAMRLRCWAILAPHDAVDARYEQIHLHPKEYHPQSAGNTEELSEDRKRMAPKWLLVRTSEKFLSSGSRKTRHQNWLQRSPGTSSRGEFVMSSTLTGPWLSRRRYSRPCNTRISAQRLASRR